MSARFCTEYDGAPVAELTRPPALDDPLEEILDTLQVPGEGFRRWFSNTYFDCIVWYMEDRTTLVGFQLCYDRNRQERALTWTLQRGYSHYQVDDGEHPRSSRMKGTPILSEDGELDAACVGDRFLQGSVGMEPELAAFIYARVMECDL